MANTTGLINFKKSAQKSNMNTNVEIICANADKLLMLETLSNAKNENI